MEKNLTKGNVFKTLAFFADTLFPMGMAATAGSFLSVLICVGAYIWLKRKSEVVA